jgi:hypothetical protein
VYHVSIAWRRERKSFNGGKAKDKDRQTPIRHIIVRTVKSLGYMDGTKAGDNQRKW